MTGWDVLRGLIVAVAVVGIFLWIRAGARSRQWRLPAAAIAFCASVIIFFGLRLVYHNPLALNYISLGIYLEAVCLLAAMAARVRP